MWVLEHPNTILAVLAAVHVLAMTIVNLTPTPADNNWLGKAYKVLEGIAGVVSASAKEHPGERKIINYLRDKPK